MRLLTLLALAGPTGLAGCSEAPSGGAGTVRPSSTRPTAETSTPSTASGRSPSAAGAAPQTQARLDPARFVHRVDNPYFPLVPGTRWRYAVTSEDGNQRDDVAVTTQTRLIQGVGATVVHDRVTSPKGAVLEDTYDWYAQDVDGNVWYLGEDTRAYDKGQVSTEGSWEVGIGGARAGVIMLAHPVVGKSYQQEYLKGEAEDAGKVLALDAAVTVPFGSFTGALKTEDTTPLEPDVVEFKYYATGIGSVYEQMVRGGDEKVRLVEMTRP